MNHVTENADIEAIARCLATEAQNRRARKRGFHETDDLADALDWLGYVKEAERLSAEGAHIVGGKLII